MALTHERLTEVIHYHPDTGVFTWLKSTAKRIKVGDRAGYTGVYTFIRIDGTLHRAHRLAWFYMHGSWPVEDVDHKDRDPSNNSKTNLREASDSQNLFNAKLKSDNTSGVKGVSWSSRDNKWRAYISAGKGKHKGPWVFQNQG